MNFNDNLKKLQNNLKTNAIDFCLVFSCDEFLRETSNLNINARYLLSGFSGTSGNMLITGDEAFLFVDGRYYIQADKQADLSKITVVKLSIGEYQDLKIIDIIKSKNIKSPKIAFDSAKISCEYFDKLKENLDEINPQFTELPSTRTEIQILDTKDIPVEICGLNSEAKIKKLKLDEGKALLCSCLDDIAYISNKRSFQNEFSSSFDAYGIIVNNKLHLTYSLKDFEENIADLKDEIKTILYNPKATSRAIFNMLEKIGAELVPIKQSPVAVMKSFKNPDELSYIKDCYQKTDKAIISAQKELCQSLVNNQTVTLGEFLNILITLCKKEGITALSFKPILAINEQSAVIHCTEFDNQQVIKNGDLVLLDFGVYFAGGYATDMTRTFIAGEGINFNPVIKKAYTTVLRAFLNTLNHDITDETTYFDLDAKARSIINSVNLEDFSFNHSTGHGVGINVHEHPPILAPSELSKQKVLPDQVFTIEPGLYAENTGGVRLENTVYTEAKDGKIKITSLNRLPFDERLIIFEDLTEQERLWLKEIQSEALNG
ncbi:MAG: M24 family metallopeptidase [Candidatus Gastranaerophilales bacterium]|nr:M24 family metallopeptidase [Candidatus Gastranaerophilales bacterium]